MEIESLVKDSKYKTVTVAVCGSKSCKLALKWALDKFIPEGRVFFKLLHVRQRIIAVPTPMGNLVPISKVRDDIVAAYKSEIEWQTNEMLLPFKQMCSKRQVEAEVIIIEADELAEAIAVEIAKSSFTRLVIGGSSRNVFTRKIKGRATSARIAKCAPNFCTVYVVSKGRLSSVHPSTSEISSSNIVGGSEDGFSISGGTSNASSSQTETSAISRNGHSNDASISSNQVDFNLEIERLRIKLKHIQGMCTIAQNEKKDASQELNQLNKRKVEVTESLREISLREQQAREVATLEKEMNQIAQRETVLVKERAERERLERNEAEIEATQNDEKGLKQQQSVVIIDQKYKKFSWEEITLATSSFSDAQKIGMGAYGTVYKCKLIHITAAVKILHAFEGKMKRQFQRELEILSSIHHPHLLLLLGACPERGCLVYEYMENGSLEDRLLRRNGTPPILWYQRYRIAWEIASALAYLHNIKPRAVVHRDLKPSNILLDQNLVCKVGDVGLSTLLPSDISSLSTMFKDTTPVGTLCYIDPEYQRSGLVSPKSDLYAFGIVILQLLTAKPAMALSHIAETALEEGNLASILDAQAGQWPLEETQDLALLGINCTELKKDDRPDLNSQILPMLERLKDFAERAAQTSFTAVPKIPPSHFICPILKDVMNDPYVAADGYTYDKSAIEVWFSTNDKSPVTGSVLPHKHLIPNYTLLSAIKEWRATNT